MCGIAGYYGTLPGVDDRVDATLATMRRRGPDAIGSTILPAHGARRAILIHSRLKIIDLEARANQPFSYNGKHLVFNGEIYNYIELRERLIARGHHFTTTSDVEVLIHHLDEFGEMGIADLEGMWAFAIYDEGTGCLLLSRDRFGEKPLYFVRDDTGIFFASEVKSLAALMDRRLQLNIEHVQRFMVNGYKALYKHTSNQFFRGLEVLQSGGVVSVCGDGQVSAWRYWNPTLEQDGNMSFDEAVSGTRDRLLRSLELRLRADVPLAFMLSGGVDSNSLIGLARREFGYDVHGFTVVASDERYGEADEVRASVRALGIRHSEIAVDKTDFLPKLRSLVRYHDAPVATTVDYAIWQLMKAVAARGYKVTVSGCGADELFSGYYDHHLFYLAETRGLPLHQESLRHWRDRVQPFVRNPYLSDPDRFSRTPAERAHIYLGAEDFARLFHKPWREPFCEAFYSNDLLRNRMANEMFHESVPLWLHEEDLNAMYYSVENRSPFLDSALFGFANRIPTRHLIRRGFAKAVLREAVRGVVPDHVIDASRKVGFNVPTEDYLDLADPEIRSYLTDDSPIFDYVNRNRIIELISTKEWANSRSKALFNFVSAKLFVEEFV